MASDPCDGCGQPVKIPGGIANIWTFADHQGTGMTLEFEDGTSHLLCYPCIEALPDDPTEADVEALEPFDS